MQQILFRGIKVGDMLEASRRFDDISFLLLYLTITGFLRQNN